MEIKKCKSCGEDKDISDFRKHRLDCKACCYDKDYQKQYQKEYRSKNKDYQKQYQKEYRSKNKESAKNYRLQNADSLKEYLKEYMKSRKSKDILFKLSCNIRTLLSCSIKDMGYNKGTKTEAILGCSFDFLKEYIESKWEPWMSWDNRGLYNGEFNYGWDIDHIIPISSAKTEEEILLLNHYTNLQPLCSKINRDIKKDKIWKLD